MRTPLFALSLLLVAFTLAQAPEFEVASVRRSPSGTLGAQLSTDPGRLTVHNMGVQALIRFAYGVDNSQISGAPAWFRTETYDIIAKAEQPVGDDKIKLMLQALLAERFKLAVHRETKEGTTYALVVSKGGPKMKEAAAGEGSSLQQKNGGNVFARAVSMAVWAHDLTRLTAHPVADETGLKGLYDFTLQWSPDPGQPMSEKDAASPVDATGPSLFTALQEQLGLKLEARKGQVETLVIDHAERASEN